jgi:hypothetical protein
MTAWRLDYVSALIGASATALVAGFSYDRHYGRALWFSVGGIFFLLALVRMAYFELQRVRREAKEKGNSEPVARSPKRYDQ